MKVEASARSADAELRQIFNDSSGVQKAEASTRSGGAELKHDTKGPRKDKKLEVKKSIVLIRHGQSMAQVAHDAGVDRTTEWSLRDAPCSAKGNQQAQAIQGAALGVDLVIVSPLTRALTTMLFGFVGTEMPMICHPAAKEFNFERDDDPENIPRAIEDVMTDLESIAPDSHRVDFSLLPPEWPKVENKPRPADLIEFISSRPEQRIAVVCHHNVIKSILGKGGIPNAKPIECVLRGVGPSAFIETVK